MATPRVNVMVKMLTDVIVVGTFSCFDLVFSDEGPNGVFGTFTLPAANSLNPIRAKLRMGGQ